MERRIRLVAEADYSRMTPRFSTIKFISKKYSSHKEFEAEINKRLTLEKGFRAFLDVFYYRPAKENKSEYFAKIIPHKFVPRNSWPDASDDLLKRLEIILDDLEKD